MKRLSTLSIGDLLHSKVMHTILCSRPLVDKGGEFYLGAFEDFTLGRDTTSNLLHAMHPPISWLTNFPPAGAPWRAKHVGQI
jgi:hypothetical protein